MTPREELVLVEQHISETEDSIMRQLQLIAHLAADGHDTREAEELLQVFEHSLAAVHEHRQLSWPRSQASCPTEQVRADPLSIPACHKRLSNKGKILRGKILSHTEGVEIRERSCIASSTVSLLLLS
jgi:hypothetical protein